MPEEVIRAIMSRRNPRTGHNYTHEEAERIIAARRAHDSPTTPMHRHPKHWSFTELDTHLKEHHGK